MADSTSALARFSAATPLAHVPASVQQRLKECLLDFVGNAAFAAASAESTPAFRAGAAALGYAAGESTVIGESGGHAGMVAALLNGAYAHTLDFDDTNVWGTLHPGAPVIAAALVEAERARASGAQLLAALAVGYEVACRVGAALGQTAYDRGFHVTGVAGLFGAVAAAGRLRALDAEAIEQAFGLAGSKAAASMQYLENGAWNKRLHPGFAAHDALVALAFAQAGVLAARAPLEGRYGVLAGYTNAARPELLTDRLGQWWPSGGTAIKPFPCCRLTHGAIEAALALREQPGARDGAGAQRLRVRLSPKAVQLVGQALPNKVRPQNIVDGQFSVYFQVAVAWCDGRSTWQSYERLQSPEVQAQCEAIEVVADPQVPLAGAVVTMGDRSVRIDEPLGESSRPFDGERLRAKFDSLAAPVLGRRAAGEVAHRIAQLQDEADAASLIRLLRREERQ
jgi:2-methylcitrate dehydratase PrpD